MKMSANMKMMTTFNNANKNPRQKGIIKYICIIESNF